MQRFRFRLTGLLRLRSQMERASRRALAVAMGNVVAVEQRIAAATESLQQCEDHGRGLGAAAQLARSLEQGLTRYQWRLQRELRAAEAQLDRARTDWTERRRDEQALQKLRETAKAQWRAASLRHEQHELEELARLRAGAPVTAREVKS
jgi:flagellar export protein FliJ